jgi:hypothetical protein
MGLGLIRSVTVFAEVKRLMMQDEAEPFVEPFLDLVKSMYANTKTVVEKEFGERGGSGLKPPVSSSMSIM